MNAESGSRGNGNQLHNSYVAPNQSCLAGRRLWSQTRVFELIALLLEAIFSWPMVPSDWPPEPRRLVHLLYVCLLGAVLALGLLKVA